MENYPEKIDRFTDFAKQKLNSHTIELSHQLANHDSIEFRDTVHHLHKQSFEIELTGKIRELDEPSGVLMAPLTILKDYYMEIFERNVAHE